MLTFITSLPLWFTMPLIAGLIIAIIYRFVRYGVKIKAGSIEIDATDDTTDDGNIKNA